MVYEDNLEVEEAQAFLTRLTSEKDEEKLYEILEQQFPGWITTFSKDYSDDYSHLRNNWHHLCEKIGVSPRGIVLVSYLHPPHEDEMDKPYIIGQSFVVLNGVVNYLFGIGYLLRRVEEFNVCESCNCVRPNKRLWTYMHNGGIPSPDTYTRNCC